MRRFLVSSTDHNISHVTPDSFSSTFIELWHSVRGGSQGSYDTKHIKYCISGKALDVIGFVLGLTVGLR